MIKWSKYNFVAENEDGKTLLYNSLSNNLIRIDKDEYIRVKDILKVDSILKTENDDSLNLLYNQGFITKSDEKKLSNLRLGKILNNFSENYANICIAPTQDCNFDCSYCFEIARDAVYFDAQMEQRVIDFLCSYPKDKDIFIEWYGGEPLYAFDSIKNISAELIKRKRNFSASIVSNGYLLNVEIAKQFKDLKIRQIQITLDGLKETHNKRRKLKKGESGTFDTIVENINQLIAINNEIEIHVRVNIDKTNSDEFHLLYKYLNIEFGKDRVYIYPGFVEDNELSISSNSCSLNEDKKAGFLLEQYKRYDIYTKLYPSKSHSDCMMRQKDSWLIGPNGDLYKCMSDLGNKDKVVGNLENGITNPDLLNSFLIGADPFIDKVCSKCKNLPECGGGCPRLRLEMEENNSKNRPCSVFKNNMPKFIKSYENYIYAKNI